MSGISSDEASHKSKFSQNNILNSDTDIESQASHGIVEGHDIDLIYDDPGRDVQLEKIHSHLDPEHLGINKEDPWKYHIDKDTNLRIVQFHEKDKQDPRQFSKAKKWYITVMLGIVCFSVAFASAVITGDMTSPAETFGVSLEVSILAVTVFVIGFGVGPLVFAPASEEFGRQAVYATTLLIAVIFIIPCGAAKNIGTMIVCRLIDGIAFSAPMTVIGGSLADMWKNEERGIAMAIFSAAPFLGPVCGPLVGGFIGDYASTWRWIYWVLLILCVCVYVALIVTVPETHHATILRRRAKKLKKITGDERYRAVQDVVPRPNMTEIMKITLTRPFLLLTEVIVFLLTLYMTVIYGLLYMFFFAYPVVFGEGKMWSDHKVGLAFIPLAIGVIAGTACAPYINKDYQRRVKGYQDKGEIVPPEIRLIPMMFGCWFVPIGLFIFAWTSFPSLSYWGPIIGSTPCGFGFILLYNSANNYIVDSYQHYAASALAAKTFVRSIWGACVPLFTIQMYHRLGYEWAGSLLGFISLACCLIPYLFFFFGASIRKHSKYAYSP